jgi:hypothetical protein
MTFIIGIDPGKSGAMAVIGPNGIPTVFRFNTLTNRELWLALSEYGGQASCWLEQVHSMPHQGVRSSFTFGQEYGMVQGLLTAAEIPFSFVTPMTWQREMGVKTKAAAGRTKTEHKRALLEMAQRLYPTLKLTLDCADAVLIAHWALHIRNRTKPFFDPGATTSTVPIAFTKKTHRPIDGLGL